MTQLTTFRVYDNEEKQLKEYKRRLDKADEKFEKWEPKAKSRLERYRLDIDPREFSQQGHRIVVPAGLSVIDSLFSGMVSVEPRPLVRNLGLATREQSAVATQGIREVWREAKVPEAAERAIKDALILDIGWVKVGYDYAERRNVRTRSEDDVRAEVRTLIEQTEAAGTEAPTVDQIVDLVPLQEEFTEVLRDRIVVDHVPYNMIRWDTAAKRIEDVRWIAQYTRLHPAEVQDNPQFREFVKGTRGGGIKKLEKIQADQTLTKKDDFLRAEGDDRVTLVEFWDFETGTVASFIRNGEFFLNHQPNPMAINEDLVDKSPFVPLTVRLDPDNVLGISDMRAALPSILELQLYRTELANYLERHKTKILAPTGAFTQAGQRALKSREHGAVVEYTQGINPGMITPLTPPALPQEAFEMEKRIEDSIREATGVNELMRGLFPQRRQTATAVAEVATQSLTRQSEKQTRLERFYRDIARRILMYMQLFYDAPRISRLVGEGAEEIWTWNAEDIVMESDLEIFLVPKETQSSEDRQQKAFAVLNLILALPKDIVDHRATLRWALEEADVPRDVIELIINTAEEGQEQQQEEIELLAQQAQAQQGIQPGGGPEVPVESESEIA